MERKRRQLELLPQEEPDCIPVAQQIVSALIEQMSEAILCVVLGERKEASDDCH